MYIVQQLERGLFTVGFFNPAGGFVPHCDTNNRVMAERIVNYLNGGNGFPFDLKPPERVPFAGGAPGKFAIDPDNSATGV